MQITSSSSFVDRIVGALRLDPNVYEEIEHADNATGQAAIIVAVSAILSGIGSVQGRPNNLLGGVIGALLLWAIFAVFAYVVGAYVLRSAETSSSVSEVLRVLGFAYAPTALGVLGVIGGIGGIVALIAGIWFLVASIVGLRQAFEVSTGRAVAIAIVAALLMAIVVGLIFVGILGLTIGVFEAVSRRSA